MSLLSALIPTLLHGSLNSLLTDATQLAQLAALQTSPGQTPEVASWSKVIPFDNKSLNLNAVIGVPKLCDANHAHTPAPSFLTFAGWLYEAATKGTFSDTFTVAIGTASPQSLASLTDPASAPSADVTQVNGVATVSAITCVDVTINFTVV